MQTGASTMAASGKGGRAAAWTVLALGATAAVLLLLTLAAPRGADAAERTQEFPVAANSSNQLAPAIGGDLVVWEDERDNLSTIYGKRVPGGQEFPISSGPNVKKKPVTDGDFVVWEDHRDGTADVYGYDLAAGQEFPIATGPGEQRKPKISGNVVVWEDNRSGDWEIYRFDLGSRQEALVSTGAGSKYAPAVSGTLIVWQQKSGAGRSDIRARDLDTGEEFTVSAGEAYKDMPAVSGTIVVWRQESVANYDIFGRDVYAKNLETGEVFQITTETSDQVAPAISGTVVVWEDHRGGDSDIRGKDLSTGEEFQVAAGAAPQASPAISGETVVWEEQRVSDPEFGSYDVQGAQLDTAPARPRGFNATPSREGVELEWEANGEPDLAGYDVYRKGADGNFTKLNAQTLAGDVTRYSDGDAKITAPNVYRVRAVDAAGHESAGAEVQVAAQKITRSSLRADSSTILYGTSTILKGKLVAGKRPLRNKTVTLESKPVGGGEFTAVSGGTLTTNRKGIFRKRVAPRENTIYRVRFEGNAEANLLPSTSPQRRVSIRPKILLKDLRRLGEKLQIEGTVQGVQTGTLRLVIMRDGRVVSRQNIDLSAPDYSFVYALPRSGKYSVRASIAEDSTHLAGRSPLKVIQVPN